MVKQQSKDLLSKVIQHISSYDQLDRIERNRGCVDGKIIGTGRSDYTQEATEYNLTIGDKTFTLIDIPGIEGDESKFEEVIQHSLDKAHTIFYVNGSGKKPEQATLEKMKKYMHDGTSVYAIFNVHCKAKKARNYEIDKKFEDELNSAYLKQDEIINQTENELKTFLGDNYKGSLSLNGLLSFCGYAIDESGKSTIVREKDKNLRSDQEKYLNEYFDSREKRREDSHIGYSDSIEKLREDSHIGLVQNIIDDKVDSFDTYIYSENIKKLKNRMWEMISRIDKLRLIESEKIKGFIETYSEFESNCYTAKEDYIHIISHIGYNAASDAFVDVNAKLFQMVEENKGKTDPSKIQKYFDTKKVKIINDIQDSLNVRMSQAQKDYEEAIEDAVQRLIKDFEREQTKFEISLSAGSIELDDSFTDAFKYNLKTFGEDLLCIGRFGQIGAQVGSKFFGIGIVVGSVTGIVLGVLSRVWHFFASEEKRINKAKEELQRAINEQIYEVSEDIRSELKKLNYEEIINSSYNQIYEEAEKQKAALESIERLLTSITNDLKINYKKIS